MAGTTGLEPAASAVTGQRSNQLNYVPNRGAMIGRIEDKTLRSCKIDVSTLFSGAKAKER
jgi:hypothetical protein